LNILPSIAAYALFSTDFRGLDAAVHFIFDRQDEMVGTNIGLMQHKFLGYFPDLP
jgi:hypothetical protein